MRRRGISRGSSRSGAAFVEAAISLVVAIVLAFGSISCLSVLLYRVAIADAANFAARAAAMPYGDRTAEARALYGQMLAQVYLTPDAGDLNVGVVTRTGSSGIPVNGVEVTATTRHPCVMCGLIGMSNVANVTVFVPYE